MRKIILVLFFVVFFSLPSLVSAQSLSERWVCLNAVRCDKSDICKTYDDLDSKVHTGYLTLPVGVTLEKGSTTYIVECIATADGQICTTGNTATDMIVYKKDNYSTLKDSTNYKFDFMKAAATRADLSNPFTSKANGTMDPIVWKDSTEKSLSRQWLALNYIAPTPTAEVGISSSGAAGALQQGTFGFNTLNALGAGSDESCVTVSWDPYGRVFDSQTLEPVMDSIVNLSMKRSDGSFSLVTTGDLVGGNIINPQTVKEDGMFSFVVPDGTYKLGVVNSSYIFPVVDILKLHINYSKIYSDIYPAGTGEEIVQAGTIQHRDIPVETTGISLSTAPKMMEYFYEASSLTNKLTVNGRVSHPFTLINLYSVKPSTTDPATTTRYRQVKQVQANKMGNFTAEIDQTSFEPTESFGEVELIKTDLKTLAQNKWYQKILSFFGGFVKKVEAQGVQSTTMKFNSIPTYLEGYAYNSSGQTLANATVGIYITYSNKPYYQTKTDEKGYFKITSEKMPKVLYEIQYTSTTGAVTKITTTEFINQNQEYLTDNKVNLNVYKNEKGKVLTSKDVVTKKPTGFFQGSGVGTNTNGKTTTTTAANNNMLIVIGILIFLIIAVVIILGVYLIKKKQTEPPISPTL